MTSGAMLLTSVLDHRMFRESPRVRSLKSRTLTHTARPQLRARTLRAELNQIVNGLAKPCLKVGDVPHLFETLR